MTICTILARRRRWTAPSVVAAITRSIHSALFPLLSLWLVALAFMWFARPASAATIVITNNNDSGGGSLRQAVLAANNGDVIDFDKTAFGTQPTITLNGPIAIGTSLTVDGAAGGVLYPVIDGNGGGIFRVGAGINVALIGLQMINAACSGPGCNGAAIANSGALQVSYSTIANNSAQNGSGAAIYNDFGATLSVVNSQFYGNTASGGYGAAIYNAFAGVVNVSSSAFWLNSALAGHGGAIYNAPGATLNIVNSTVALNGAAGGYGGGIENTFGSTLGITSSTFYSNSAASGGGISNRGTTTLVNTIVAASSGGMDCSNTGILVDGGYNLDDDGSCGLSAANQSLPDTVPVLGNFGYYGGATLSVALLPGSPAIDAGTCSGAHGVDQRGILRPQGAACDIGAFESHGFTFANLSGTTQSTPIRSTFPTPLGLTVVNAFGEPVDGGRVTFAGVDTTILASVQPAIYTATVSAGAVAQTVTANGIAGGPYNVVASARGVAVTGVYSLTNLCLNPATVGNANDAGLNSLRQAVADVCPGGRVVFGSGIVGNIAVTSGPIVVARSMTIDGATATLPLVISGNNASQVFQVNAGSAVTMNRLQIVNGLCAACNGGGITSSGALTLTGITLSGNNAPGSYGGGIYNSGALIVSDSTFDSNNALGGYGGALYNDYGGSAQLVNTTAAYNSAASGYGGAFYNAYGGWLSTINTTVYGNSADGGYGGGLYNWGTLNLTFTTASGNRAASQHGGGLFNAGSATVWNTIVAGNGVGGDCGAAAGAQSIADGGYNLAGDNSCNLSLANHSLTATAALLGSFGDYGGPGWTVPLLPGSPAIDSGKCSGGSNRDERGVARPQGAACDMGAFESRGFVFANPAGTPQSTGINTAFPAPLSLAVNSLHSEPVDGGQVMFSAPAIGPSIQSPVFTITIGGGNVSRAVVANDITGGPFTVIASARGVPGFVFYFLTNQCPSQIAVDNTNDNGSGSLRQAVAQVCAGGTVVFSPAVFSQSLTIALTNDQIVIAKPLTIDGVAGGAVAPVIDGNHAYRVFQVNPGTAAMLNGLQIADGYCAIAGCNGGAINNSGMLTLSNSLVTGNSTPNGYGGGVYNDTGSTLVVSSSTLVSNTAGFGGAIANNGMLSLVNDTLYGNAALTGYGGAVYSILSLSMVNSTVASNSAPMGFGGGIANLGTAVLKNSIVTGSSSAGNCAIVAVTDGGNNLEDGNTCDFGQQSTINTNPLLGSLQVNPPGQSIPTLALLAGSPAIDAGNNATCPATDERGVHRPVGQRCDIGAFELGYLRWLPLVQR